jgi:2-hydroxy-5-methyl-1-naphthoate 7-hydroxylase
MRSLVSAAFTAHRTAALRPKIEEIARHLLDAIELGKAAPGSGVVSS